MTNPVTNADIEDVLSSIRRLVSEEVTPRAAAAVSGDTERLVLTPALRVMETERPEEALSGAVVDTAPAEDEALPDEMPSPELIETHELSALDVDDIGRRNLEARIAELEAVISDTGDHADQWEHDGEEGSANAGGPVDSLEWQDDAAPMAEDVEIQEIFTDVVVEHLSTPPLEFVADPEPEMENADATFAENGDASDPVPQDVDAYETDFAEPEDPMSEVVVDEDMLRELVADIVRQELQGALGERITRNVRKVVRREIHRALTSQDLE